MTIALPGAAQASGVVGLSGGCSDDGDKNEQNNPDPRGGDQFEDDYADAQVYSNGNVDGPDAIDTAQAVGNLAEGVVWDGESASDNCDGEQAGEKNSYVEVHVGNNQVCYDGQVHVVPGGTNCQTNDGADSNVTSTGGTAGLLCDDEDDTGKKDDSTGNTEDDGGLLDGLESTTGCAGGPNDG